MITATKSEGERDPYEDYRKAYKSVMHRLATVIRKSGSLRHRK